MGFNTNTKISAVGLIAGSLLSTSALAGGFDRGGVNTDQLFDNERFSATASVTYINPQREQKNIRRSANNAASSILAGGVFVASGGTVNVGNPAAVQGFLAANPAAAAAILGNVPAPQTGASVDANADYWVPRFGYNQSLADGVNCLFSYSEPFGADQNNGANNALSASSVNFSIDTRDYGATCKYTMAAGETSVGASQISLIGGLSYQELDGFLRRQSFFDFAAAGIPSLVGVPLEPIVEGGVAAAAGIPAAAVQTTVTNTAGFGTFDVNGDAVGWRAGLAYEIPAIALRAAIIYHSSYDYDLTGVQNNTGFGVAANNPNALVPISATTEIPQALEIKLQSGISEGTLAFANFKWQDWSKIQSVPIVGGVTATAVGLTPAGAAALPTTLAFDALYSDGYTVNVGVGQVLTENVSGFAAVTWDRGTSTTIGSQTDTWTLSGGFRYKEGENFELNLGGAVGILTGGFSAGTGGLDQANLVSYTFDDDLLLAASASVKWKLN
ncbi:MAG: transporter [Pseudomonadota bacterium]